MTEQEIKDILQQQNHFFSSGKTIPAEFRLKQLESLKEAMIRHEADLAAALKEDLGIPYSAVLMHHIWRAICVRSG